MDEFINLIATVIAIANLNLMAASVLGFGQQHCVHSTEGSNFTLHTAVLWVF